MVDKAPGEHEDYLWSVDVIVKRNRPSGLYRCPVLFEHAATHPINLTSKADRREVLSRNAPRLVRGIRLTHGPAGAYQEDYTQQHA